MSYSGSDDDYYSDDSYDFEYEPEDFNYGLAGEAVSLESPSSSGVVSSVALTESNRMPLQKIPCRKH